MSLHESTGARIAVIKIGGSILVGLDSYRIAARFVQQRLAASAGEHLLVVVSAQEHATDSLLEEARSIVAEPDCGALDLLWSTGEVRSVAMLTLHMQALGLAAVALSVHETGLRVRDETNNALVEAEPARIREALSRCAVVIVPGFLGVNQRGAIISLGRGGSDLTAVLLARSLGACRCELVKDVAGYFSSDPRRDARAAHLPQLSYNRAIAMANAGCELVQRRALEAAERASLPLVVCSLDQTAPVSWIRLVSPGEEKGFVETAMCDSWREELETTGSEV
ncbi:MAG: hypothetical protein ACRD4H_04445 [Candidatus Acidiferrales bacterium]